ncbi:MAG: hypothetical protein M3N28_06115 [Actinomycetota bacterium]|nr:hypothetical protein [Actinomycetota bacterium]
MPEIKATPDTLVKVGLRAGPRHESMSDMGRFTQGVGRLFTLFTGSGDDK